MLKKWCSRFELWHTINVLIKEPVFGNWRCREKGFWKFFFTTFGPQWQGLEEVYGKGDELGPQRVSWKSLQILVAWHFQLWWSTSCQIHRRKLLHEPGQVGVPTSCPLRGVKEKPTTEWNHCNHCTSQLQHVATSFSQLLVVLRWHGVLLSPLGCFACGTDLGRPTAAVIEFLFFWGGGGEGKGLVGGEKGPVQWIHVGQLVFIDSFHIYFMIYQQQLRFLSFFLQWPVILCQGDQTGCHQPGNQGWQECRPSLGGRKPIGTWWVSDAFDIWSVVLMCLSWSIHGKNGCIVCDCHSPASNKLLQIIWTSFLDHLEEVLRDLS